MKQKKYFTIILFLLVNSIFAQSLSLEGTIIDNSNLDPIENAKIELYKETTLLYETNSDFEGNFKLSVSSGKYNAKILKEGYFSEEFIIEIENKNITLPDISLMSESEVQNLDEIVITAKKKNIQITNSGIVLRVDDSPFFDNATVLESLSIVPGVNITSGNSLNILGKQRILVLVNGRETNLSISDLPVRNVEKIEVNSSPDAKYDAKYDAVINVFLKKWVYEGFNGGINSTLTINKKTSHNNNFYLNYNKNKFNVSTFFSLDKHETIMTDDGYKKSNNIMELINSKRESEKLAKYGYINLNYDISNTDKIGIELDYLDVHAQSDNNGYSKFIQNTMTKVDSSFVSKTINNLSNKYYSMGMFYSKKTDRYGLEGSLKYFVNTNNNNSNFTYSRSDKTMSPVDQITDMDSNNGTLVSTLDYKRNLSNEGSLETGIRYTKFSGDFMLDIDINKNKLNNILFDFDENIYAYYVNYKNTFNEFSFQAGTRAEYFDRRVLVNKEKFNNNKLDIFPSFSVDYTPSNVNYYKLSYSKKIVRPSFNQITPFQYFTSYNTKFEGNPDLKNQISHNIEFLYQLNQKYYFILYSNFNKDYIEQTGVIDKDFISINKPVNYNYHTLGFQTGFTQQITPWLTSMQKFSIEKVSSEGVLLNNNFSTKSWEANLYFAEIFNFNKKGSFIIVGNYYTPQYFDIYKVKQGFKLDVKYSVKFFDNNLTASFSARDVLNTYYNKVSSSYQGYSSFLDKDINNRDFVFSLSYNFGKGRDKDIKTGTDISNEKSRLAQ